MKYSGIGGQAVIEGVMMKGKGEYAVAVRKPDKDIEIKKQAYKSIREKYRMTNFPIIRGVVTFVESLITGMSTLNYSASFLEEEEEKAEKSEKQKKQEEKKDSILMGIMMIVAIVAAIGIFVLVPFFISEALKKPIPSAQLRGLLEGVIRVALFVLYVKLISLMEDIKRVFMYHGAEHKSINCIEHGYELTVENVRKQTTVHKRCGTSFMLVVMFVSILFFMFIVVGNMWLRMILRLLLVPVIAGVAYEFIRFAGSHDNEVINVLSKPGLWLQSLTTAEPTDDMIEVAIASVDAVFDWREFISHIDEPEKNEDIDIEVTELSDTVTGDATKVSMTTTTNIHTKEDVKEETASAKEEELPQEKKPSQKKKPSQEKKSSQVGDIEIVAIDAADEEDDEILNALDRYFEAPEAKDLEK